MLAVLRYSRAGRERLGIYATDAGDLRIYVAPRGRSAVAWDPSPHIIRQLILIVKLWQRHVARH